MANITKYAAAICDESKVEPVEPTWEWGEEELPRVDQYHFPWSTRIVCEVSYNSIHEMCHMRTIVAEKRKDRVCTT